MRLFNIMKPERKNTPPSKPPLDEALEQCECLSEYEEIMELWKTYGGD